MTDDRSVTVRLADPTDATELAEIGETTVRAYHADGFIDDPQDGYAHALRDAAARARDAELWVAVDDASSGVDVPAVLGTVTYCPPGSPYRELSADDEGEFRMLAVDPSARGLGVGRLLVRRCIDRSRADGYQGMVLCSLPDMTAAHALYRSFGFARDEARDWYPVPEVVLWAFSLRFAMA